jgi:Tol biopolymer transport system component
LALGAPITLATPLPEGPRLAFGLWSATKRERLTVQTVGADGSRRQTLVGDGRIGPLAFDGGSWSPDGSMLAFSGSRREDGDDEGRIYLAPADGGAVVAVPGTQGGEYPVFSPDRRTIAFSRLRFEFGSEGIGSSGYYSSATAWIIDLVSGQARRLTGWHDGRRVTPMSFSPDGRTLLADRARGHGLDVVLLDVATGRMSLFARHAHSATYSPDGSQVSLLSERDHLVAQGLAVGELYVTAADGSRWRRITRNLKEEESPGWDPSGQRLAYAQSTGSQSVGFGFTNVVMQVNVDGSCPMRLAGRPRSRAASSSALWAPTWRPGPGREAGPIAC